MTYLRESYKRWLAWLVLASLFAVACGFLSQWQFDRRAHRVAQIQIVENNYDAPPVAATKLLGGSLPDSQLQWRPVVMTGRYLNDKALLVRNRPQNGQPGFELVVPFDSQGYTMLVDLGWLPTGNLQDSPDHIPLPSTSAQRIEVRLMMTEPSLQRDAPKGQVAEIDLKHIAQVTQMPINLKWYGSLVSGNINKLPLQLTKPTIDEGNHLSYAFQWIVFAILGFAVLVWAIRKEIHFARLASDPSYRPASRKTTRAERDAAAEDSELQD